MTKIQKAILEADEEDEGKEDEEGDKAEETGSESSGDDSDLTDDTPFAGLDLRGARCFGFKAPSKKCWTGLAAQAEDLGWRHIDPKALEKSLAKDVEDSYLRIAQLKFVNVDDNTAYTAWFDNGKALWGLEISDSPEAELEAKERADFFNSALFKKAAQKAYDRLVKAKAAYFEIVKPHLDFGELLLVDTVKLGAILSFLDDDHFLENLLERKYLGY